MEIPANETRSIDVPAGASLLTTSGYVEVGGMPVFSGEQRLVAPSVVALPVYNPGAAAVTVTIAPEESDDV